MRSSCRLPRSLSLVAALALSSVLGACPQEPEPDPAPTPPRAPYTVRVLDDARITSDGNAENFQNVQGGIDWGAGPFARVVVRVQLATTCFPFSGWENDPPPAGHNWPPLCDAFDRNFEVTLLSPGESREQGVELVRAITPFGGPMAFEADITDVANARPGANDVHVHITTFADGQGLVSGANGGWNVTVDVDVEEGEAPRNVLAVVSAFNGVITEGGVEQLYPFTLPAGTTRTTLAVRTTGHGGPNTDSDCIGPAEEFCRRFHFTRVDDIDLAFSEPFIESCEDMCTLAHEGPVNGGFDYCQENPTGAIQSVRAPRANWCPGAVTEPRVYDDALDRLGAGEHTLGYEVERIAPGGSWRTSATFTAYGE